MPVKYELQTLGPDAAHIHLFVVMSAHLLLSALHTLSQQESCLWILDKVWF